jgi:dephospho-CoA kinase
MLTIALTGNVAAGKTQVADLFRRWGATVVDDDRLVREAQAPGTPVFNAIVSRFGPDVVGSDGSLDRGRLRALVFADAEARRSLETLVHPEVARRRRELVEDARRRGDRVVVCDVPLLFEVLDPAEFDAVVLVDAPATVRLDRLRDRGLATEEAHRVMAAQMPAETKRAWRGGPGRRGPQVIENDGDRTTLERRARVVWDALLRGAGG